MKGYIKKQALMDYCSNQVSKTIDNNDIARFLIANVIPIPEDATNGDVIKALFPNVEWHSAMKQTTIFIPQTAIYEKEVLRVSTEWWNAKYKAESEE